MLVMMQETVMRDVHLSKVALDALLSYHPFWLRLGLEVVLGRHIASQKTGAGHRTRPPLLREVVLQCFLADEHLARVHSFNQTRHGLQTTDYWVRVALAGSDCYHGVIM